MTSNSVQQRIPRPHAEVIKWWADSAPIQSCQPGSEFFSDDLDPKWWPDWKYRVKPEKTYPLTQMTARELTDAFQRPCDSDPIAGFVSVANAALRAACESQQVIPMPEVQEVARNLSESMLAKHVRDTAEAVFLACQVVAGRYAGAAAQRLREGVDIDKIIAGVKP